MKNCTSTRDATGLCADHSLTFRAMLLERALEGDESERINPRVVAWLASQGLSPADIARDPEGDCRRLTIGKYTLPWTIHYSEWIRARWRDWAAFHGYTQRVDGWDSHDLAIADGLGDFDEWLPLWVADHLPASEV